MTQPYRERLTDGVKRLRTFSAEVAEQDLVWHRDAACRDITHLDGSGWQFQFDNQLPFRIEQQKSWHVPAGVYHRLLKGNSDLTIEIVEQRSNRLECNPHPSQTLDATDEHHICLCDRCFS